MREQLSNLQALLQGYRYRSINESELQQAVAGVLQEAGWKFQREVVLSGGRDRIDFLGNGIGIEVKVDGSNAALIRQAFRYLKHDEIGALIVVTTRLRHSLPSEMNGKSVHLVRLWRQAL